ncbi:MAG: flavodoxin [Bacilli bacterium]|jgi:flavodoxin
MKALVLYYSNSSHTASVAAIIADTIKAEKEAIRVLLPYGDTIMDRSRSELEKQSYPDLVALNHDLKDYDTIVLGTPTWWVAPSSPVLSLIKSGVLKGKKVYPFITTGFDVTGVEDKLKEALKGSIVEPALIISFTNAFMDNPESDIVEYAKKIR